MAVETVIADLDALKSRCVCCLEEGEQRLLWTQYVVDDEVEVYGAMLKECYDFPWVQPTDELEQICMKCIQQLKAALAFRRDIVAIREVFENLVHELKNKPDGMTTIKIEMVEKDNCVKLTEETILKEDEKETEEVTDDDQEMVLNYDVKNESQEELSDDDDDSSQMEVEYLEDDEGVSYLKEERNCKGKRKYKQYSKDDLEAAIEMVASNKMVRSLAADVYSIPVKTLNHKLRVRERRVREGNEEQEDQSKYKLIDEVKTILTFTNATPFKTKIGRLFCAYCSTDGPVFEDDSSLRTHTRIEHAALRIKNVEVFMRPFYLNYILKLDIQNLACTVCCTSISDWNSMFEHLKEAHDTELDLAYTRVIPYVLAEDIACCLCTAKFPHHHMLDIHMNKHYNNFMCGDCGDTFITESRLKKHLETHSVQKFPCSECDKVFTLEKYRKKHYDGVHLRESKFKCHYCSESFQQDYTRHLHVVKTHPEKVKTISCESCLMTFTWRPYYLKHMKLNHTVKEKQFKCKYCTKTFVRKYELRNHEQWHSGAGFTCHVCDKKFSSKTYLSKHIKKCHSGDGVVYVVETVPVEVPESKEEDQGSE